MIPLPENAIPDVIYYIRTVFTDLAPLIFLIAGIYLSWRIIELIVDIFTSRKAKESGYYHEFRNDYPTGRGRYFEEGEDFDDDDDN